jgi:hypothetical protein
MPLSATERCRPLALLADAAFCSAARREAASAGDSRADMGARRLLLPLRLGDARKLGRAVRLPLGCRSLAAAVAAADEGGEGTGMRLLGACRGQGRSRSRGEQKRTTTSPVAVESH